MKNTANLRSLNVLLLGLFALQSIVLGASSIRDVDFKNFAYPFIREELASVPVKLRWMPPAGGKLISLRDGRYSFPCDDAPCPLLTLAQTDFVNINGLPETSALVVITYHTGGTATWQYLYVMSVRARKPVVVAWLETGSRAYMGLRHATIDRGDLLLTVDDPEKRTADCCSSGTITYRYRWDVGAFQQIGAPVLEDDPR
jgi:hypothetical protein